MRNLNDILNSNEIKYFRSIGQVIDQPSNNDSLDDDNININKPLPTKNPVIALLDGLPISNHSLLANRLNIREIEEFEENNPAQSRLHGTEMASLIIHGDLSSNLPPLNSTLYVRPILKFCNNIAGHTSCECLPSDQLIVDIIHQSIIEIENNPELKASIKIINLSVGSEDRPFFGEMSPAAKMIDYLSHKYNLLFLISAGNNVYNLELGMKEGEFDKLSQEDQQKAIYDYMWKNQCDMRILSPSESINAITVGATNEDDFFPMYQNNQVDSSLNGFPAIYSRFGGGYLHAIKPECLFEGGRLLYSRYNVKTMDVNFRPILHGKYRPGLVCASPTSNKATRKIAGTSAANALASRTCAFLLDSLHEIPNLHIPEQFDAVALKAMLIHCCSWGEVGRKIMSTYVPQNRRRRETIKWIGYGFPNQEISLFCTSQRATFIGYGTIKQDKEIDFTFPLPDCLISNAVEKKLTITLAWMSPIAPNNKNYKLAKLSFHPKNRDKVISDSSRIVSDYNSATRGTVQHEVITGSQAATYESNENMVITVSCKREPNLKESVNFVIMASLEVKEQTNLPIYQEIVNKLKMPIDIRNNSK